METIKGTFSIVGYVFGFIFPIWPLILLEALGSRRRMVFRAMLATWVFFFIGWLFARAVSPKPLFSLIPEPLNIFLFFLTGAGLIGWLILRERKEHQYIHETADKARTSRDLLDASPSQFEKMVMELYSLRGYDARRTGAIGDHGVDVVVKTPKGAKWIVQCKRWRGWVGEPVVRDFYGTLHHEKADRGILITTGTFSNAAREWAKGKPLALVDGDEFLRAWKDVKNK